MYLKNIVGHFMVITRHKWVVFKLCCKVGQPWRGLVHDLSKYSPTEFWEGVKYFNGKHSPITDCKKTEGYSKAWLHHKGRNKHHYEYWQDNFDKGTTHLIMPYKYALEMVCDYLGAGNAYSGDKFSLQGELAWWENKKKNDIAMSPAIFHFVDILMKIMSKENSTDVLKRKRSYKLYKVCIRNYKHLS